MAEKSFSRGELYALRNDICVKWLIKEVLHVPCETLNGRFSFLCPLCKGFTTGVHPQTNLARCFDCGKNFNPIDLVMMVRQSDFVEAVRFLKKPYDTTTATGNHPQDAAIRKPSSDGATHIGPILAGITKPVNESNRKHPPDHRQSPDDSELSDRILRLEQKMAGLGLKVDRLGKVMNRLFPSV